MPTKKKKYKIRMEGEGKSLTNLCSFQIVIRIHPDRTSLACPGRDELDIDKDFHHCLHKFSKGTLRLVLQRDKTHNKLHFLIRATATPSISNISKNDFVSILLLLLLMLFLLLLLLLFDNLALKFTFTGICLTSIG